MSLDDKNKVQEKIECIIFYVDPKFVDPKFVGPINFLGKGRIRFPLTSEHSSLAVFRTKLEEFAGIKAGAEKTWPWLMH